MHRKQDQPVPYYS